MKGGALLKKVGILTFYLNHNYGSTLQCYALRKAIQKISNYDVSVIPHVFIDRIVNGFGETYLREQYDKRLKKFDDFLKTEIGCTGKHISYVTKENVPKCDYYVAGSDVIWNTVLTKKDTNYFLDFADSMEATKVAYAPSLGVSDVKKLDVNIFNKYIDKFDFLSVREKRDISFIQKFTDKEVVHVLDPTFLLEKEDYLLLIEKEEKKTDEKFILLYLVYDRTENITKIIDYANRISLKKGYKVIHFIYNIPYYIFEERGESFAFSGPKEFLWYVSNAELVITNSFHGLAFSVIFQKSFYVSVRKDGETKLEGMLKELGLEERTFKMDIDFENTSFYLNYEDVDKKLDHLKKKSYEYLKKSLDIK